MSSMSGGHTSGIYISASAEESKLSRMIGNMVLVLLRV